MFQSHDICSSLTIHILHCSSSLSLVQILFIYYKHYIFIPLLGGIATKYTLYINNY